MLYVVLAGGLAVIVFVAVVFTVIKNRDKAGRKRASGWKHSDYYSMFLDQLEPEQKRRFFAMQEYEQFKAYMDWSLRAGLEHIEQTDLQE